MRGCCPFRTAPAHFYLSTRHAFAALFQRILEREQRCLQGWQVVLDGLPDDRRVNTLVFVPENVANACDILPPDIAVPNFQLIGEVTASFRDNLYSSLDCRTQNP